MLNSKKTIQETFLGAGGGEELLPVCICLCLRRQVSKVAYLNLGGPSEKRLLYWDAQFENPNLGFPIIGVPKLIGVEQAADQRPLPPALPVQPLLNTGPLHPLCLPR